MGAVDSLQLAEMVLLTRDLLPILMFGVVMPALDQFSDVAFALRLMGGPANDTVLLTGCYHHHHHHERNFPFKLFLFNCLIV